jgi:hypothetical protein
MKRSKLLQFLKRRSTLVAWLTVAPMVLVILGLCACVKHPVGDPEQSQVDPKYSGIWLTKDAEDSESLLIMRPYDARTYFASILSYRQEANQIKPTMRWNCKAWLTSIGNATFLTLEPLSCAHFAGLGDKPPYLVGKVSLVDGALHLKLVNGDREPAKSASNSRELEAAIEKHMDTDALYVDETNVFKKFDDKSQLEAILQAFRPEGCEEL